MSNDLAFHVAPFVKEKLKTLQILLNLVITVTHLQEMIFIGQLILASDWLKIKKQNLIFRIQSTIQPVITLEVVKMNMMTHQASDES